MGEHSSKENVYVLPHSNFLSNEQNQAHCSSEILSHIISNFDNILYLSLFDRVFSKRNVQDSFNIQVSLIQESS